MNAIKKNTVLTNGWILCPSKSFPGKFYYFNVLNGETAWSLNEVDKKGIKKDSSFHKIADKSHDYPEPTSLPDDTSITSYDIGPNIKKPDFLRNVSCTQQLPMFGQPAFRKYVGNVEPLMSNIVWTPVQLPLPMFCPETKKPMHNKFTQTSEFSRELFIQTSDIPLCKRFQNYEKPFLCFDKRNKIIKNPSKFETSTPRNSIFERVKNQNCVPKSKPLIKESVLKFESMLPCTKTDAVKSNENSTLGLSNKVESTKSSMVKRKEVLENLDTTDLRFLLLAKRRKSVDAATDTAVERKKLKLNEVKYLSPKKKVSFDLNDETSEDTAMSDVTTQKDFIPLTPNNSRTTIDKPNAPFLNLKDKTPQSIKDMYTEALEEPPYVEERSVPTARNNTWYIVVDTDVLLLDYEMIDNLVLSDPKCKLVIPHAVRLDIESLCLGDCRGQQRVINARQLTRKLVTPPPHYIVEPPTDDENGIEMTTESIINCCLKVMKKNCYVVLITNDPHLKIKASSLKINTYKLNEVKYGVNIKPEMTSEVKKQKINNANDDTDRKTQFSHNKSNLTLFSNLKTAIPIDAVNKQLFFIKDNNIDSSLVNCDKLIDITKPKCQNIDINKSDSDTINSDISREVQNLVIKDENVLKTRDVNRNPFLLQKRDGAVNYKKRTLNSVFSTYNFGKTISNTKRGTFDFENTVPNTNHDIHSFQKESKINHQNTGELFCSLPISNIQQFQLQNTGFGTSMGNSGTHVNTKIPNTRVSLRHDTPKPNKETPILNPTQARIKKIINTINYDSTTTKLDNQITKTTDNTGIFKIPQPLQFKNRTRNTSALVESSSVNDKIRPWNNCDSIEVNLKRFCVKNKTMSEKISTRIDEWICTYMQIMEDVLNNLLQKNSICMKNTMAPLNLHDTLNCIKMLYESHTKVRDLVDKLSEFLDKCVCVKGKLKTCIKPEDFMTMFGYGVLLVLALQNILPLSEELGDAELCLSALLTNIESNPRELDPELLKAPSVSRTDVDGRDEKVRPNFIKERSYVTDYLKKHFSDWSTYKGDSHDYNNTIRNNTDIKVVRTIGKNLNLLKIDKSKTLFLTKNTAEENLANRNKDGRNMIRLLGNNLLNNPDDNIANNDAGPKLMGLFNDENNKKYFEISADNNDARTDREKDVPKVMKSIENIDERPNNETNTEQSFPDRGNTFIKKGEIDGPKMIRNIKLIDEYEKRIENREPLDLDLLDYSEIYEPSLAENLEFDIISEKNNKSEENNKNNNLENDNNYGLTDTVCVLEDFTQDINIENYNNFYTCPPNYESKNNNYNFNINKTNEKNDKNNIFFSFSNNDKVINSNIEENTQNINFEMESETYTEKPASYIENTDYHPVRDDSTNDSGFENDSTYAHSVVKIFLNELSTSFKVIYRFVTTFVDEIREKELCELRKKILHNQASKSLEDMVAIIDRLRSVIKRESAEDTVLKTLLIKAGVEATTDKRITRYRQIVIKSLKQAQILEKALKIIVSTTIGDFDALSTNAESINSIRYFNIFE